MKLYEFFDLLGQHPLYLVAFFIALPLFAILLWVLAPGSYQILLNTSV